MKCYHYCVFGVNQNKMKLSTDVNTTEKMTLNLKSVILSTNPCFDFLNDVLLSCGAI